MSSYLTKLKLKHIDIKFRNNFLWIGEIENSVFHSA